MTINDDSLATSSPNPYAAPEAYGSVEDDPVAEAAYYRAYVGPRSEYYLSHWGLTERSHRRLGFNLAAAFFSMIWIGYRKMYLVAAIFAGLILVETMAEEVVLAMWGLPDTSPAWDLAVNLTLGVIGGLLANRVYGWHCSRQIEQVRQLGFRGDAALNELHRRGGTSVVAAIGVVFAYMIAVVGALMLFDYLLYGPGGLFAIIAA